MTQKLLRILPALIWASLIYTLSSISTLPSPDAYWFDFFIKKSAHMTVYAVLYILVLRALGPKTKNRYQTAFIICVLYGISDEIHQGFTPGRTPRLFDVGFDTLGITAAYLKSKQLI